MNKCDDQNNEIVVSIRYLGRAAKKLCSGVTRSCKEVARWWLQYSSRLRAGIMSYFEKCGDQINEIAVSIQYLGRGTKKLYSGVTRSSKGAARW